MLGPTPMRSVFSDLRYALRTLRASPGFAAVVILTLALGLGANPALFRATDRMLVRPLLPYRQADQLLNVWTTWPRGGSNAFSLPDYHFFRDESHSFSGLGASMIVDRALGGAAVPERARAAVISPG